MDEFLKNNPEDGDYNQYWYSTYTIQEMVKDIVAQDCKVAYLSTPSLYFSVPPEHQAKSKVFDIDKKWEKDPGFVYYDYKEPESVPSELFHSFDLVVVDPPFIVKDVWEKYAITCKLLLKEGTDEVGNPLGKTLLTTVNENLDMLKEILGENVIMQKFMPSIPNLVYQYNLYTNYPSEVFSKKNPEIPDYD
jgi:EEF1A lysine methyltransferase 1